MSAAALRQQRFASVMPENVLLRLAMTQAAQSDGSPSVGAWLEDSTPDEVVDQLLIQLHDLGYSIQLRHQPTDP